MADPNDTGSIPWLELEPDDTDPEPFGTSKELDTVPRCTACGQATVGLDPFEQGKSYVLRGLYWTLCKKLSKRQASELAIWLQEQFR